MDSFAEKTDLNITSQGLMMRVKIRQKELQKMSLSTSHLILHSVLKMYFP